MWPKDAPIADRLPACKYCRLVCRGLETVRMCEWNEPGEDSPCADLEGAEGGGPNVIIIGMAVVFVLGCCVAVLFFSCKAKANSDESINQEIEDSYCEEEMDDKSRYNSLMEKEEIEAEKHAKKESGHMVRDPNEHCESDHVAQHFQEHHDDCEDGRPIHKRIAQHHSRDKSEHSARLHKEVESKHVIHYADEICANQGGGGGHLRLHEGHAEMVDANGRVTRLDEAPPAKEPDYSEIEDKPAHHNDHNKHHHGDDGQLKKFVPDELPPVAKAEPNFLQLKAKHCSDDGGFIEGIDADKPWDCDMTTFYDTTEADGAWTAAYLGKVHTVARIQYVPREGRSDRMIGGRFEGAKNMSESWQVLHTIGIQPANNPIVTTVDLTDDQTIIHRGGEDPAGQPLAFRYIRYVSGKEGYGNISVIKVFAVEGGVTQGAVQHPPDKPDHKHNHPVAKPAPKKPVAAYVAPHAAHPHHSGGHHTTVDVAPSDKPETASAGPPPKTTTVTVVTTTTVTDEVAPTTTQTVGDGATENAHKGHSHHAHKSAANADNGGQETAHHQHHKHHES